MNNGLLPYNNIKPRELAILAGVIHKENGGNLEKTEHDLESIDLMLGVMKMKSLINARDRSAKTRFSRGRGLHQVIEQILLRNG